MSDAVLLAVDGGNTKTLAVVCDASGRTLGTGRAGCGDIYGATSPEAAMDAVVLACGAALEAAGAQPRELQAAVFSLAGADWPEDYALLATELPMRLGLAVEATIVNDAHGALRGGSSDWSGVAIVYGTWCAIGARNAAGEVFHRGWWPDGSGARELGDEALRAVYRADLGTGGATALTDLALQRYGVGDPVALLHAFTHRGGRAAADAGLLAGDVLTAARAGDPIALDIAYGQATRVGAQALVAAARVGLGPGDLHVVLSGGLLSHPDAGVLVDATLAAMPGAVAATDVVPPIGGAALLALDRLGLEADASLVLGALPPSLFQRSPAWVASPSNP